MGDALDLHEHLRRDQPADHCSPGRVIPCENGAVYLVHLPEVISPSQVHVDLHHVLEPGFERLQRLLQALEALPGLGLYALQLLTVRSPVAGVAGRVDEVTSLDGGGYREASKSLTLVHLLHEIHMDRDP